MSMNKCFKCGDIYDTDYQMEEIDGEMVCDSCYEDWQEENRTDLTPTEKAISNTSFLHRMNDSAFEDMIGNED